LAKDHSRRRKRRIDGRSNSPTSVVYIFRFRILSSHSHNHYMFVYQHSTFIICSFSNIQHSIIFTTMDGDQEDRNPLDKGKGKERAQSLPETADEASTTPPTVRANSSPEGNQSVLSNHPSTSAPRLSRSPASQVREELEGGRRRSLAPGNESGPNEGTLRSMNVPPCSHIARR
jgi:hypothetical protein